MANISNVATILPVNLNIYLLIHLLLLLLINIIEASHGIGAQMCDCKRDWLWVRSPLEEMKCLFKLIFSFLRFAVACRGHVRR